MPERTGSTDRKFGFNAGVSTTEVDVRSEDADLTYQTSNQSLEILSGDAADDGLSSGTLTLVSAVAITPAIGTITIASPVANTFSTGTVDLTGGASGSVDGITVDGVEVMSGAEAFDSDLDTTAANVASNITAHTSSPNYTATSSGTLITITADALGSGPNTFVVVSSVTTITTTDVDFAGGVTADIVTANDLIYTAVAGPKADDTQFSIDGDDTATALDLADSIDDDVRAGTLNDLTAVNAAAVVTATQTVPGTGGNATTLTSSDGTRLAVSGATFAGGLEADVATINGLGYIGVDGPRANDTQFSVDTGDTEAAADLAAAINADTRTPITVPDVDVLATSSAGVVTIDSNVIGSGGDLVDIAGTANITASGATLTDAGTGARSVFVEGLDSDYKPLSEIIAVNGTSVNVLDNSYFRVNRAFIKAVGSGGVNAGNITIQVAGGGDIQAVIPAGEGQTQLSNFTVPFDKEVLLRQIDYSMDSPTGQTDFVVIIRGKCRLVGEGWRTFYSTIGITGDIIPFKENPPFPPKTDVRFTAIKLTGTGDVRVQVGYGFRIQNAV